jgi:hypothetical protein
VNPGVLRVENGIRVNPNSVIRMDGVGDYNEVIETPIGGVRFPNTSRKVPKSGLVDTLFSVLSTEDTRAAPQPSRYYR